jgi:hypothetical protein
MARSGEQDRAAATFSSHEPTPRNAPSRSPPAIEAAAVELDSPQGLASRRVDSPIS